MVILFEKLRSISCPYDHRNFEFIYLEIILENYFQWTFNLDEIKKLYLLGIVNLYSMGNRLAFVFI